MKTMNEITNEINNYTSIIKNTFPEFYEKLAETPLFLSYEEQDNTITDYKRYLSFLKSQLTELVKIYELRKHENDIKQTKSTVTFKIKKKPPLL